MYIHLFLCTYSAYVTVFKKKLVVQIPWRISRITRVLFTVEEKRGSASAISPNEPEKKNLEQARV